MITAILLTLLYILDIIWFAVILHLVILMLFRFNVLGNEYPWLLQLWTMLDKIFEPIYKPIRARLPNMALDLSPIVLFILIYFAKMVIVNALLPMFGS